MKINKGEFIPETFRQKIWEKYFYIKLFYNRAQSYTGLPMSFIEKFTLVTIWLNLWLGIKNTPLIIIGGIIYWLVMLGVGYIDVRNGIAHEETSFGNRFNPELSRIYLKTKERPK